LSDIKGSFTLGRSIVQQFKSSRSERMKIVQIVQPVQSVQIASTRV
jgi:hypothetical protein